MCYFSSNYDGISRIRVSDRDRNKIRKDTWKKIDGDGGGEGDEKVGLKNKIKCVDLIA